MFCLIKDSWFEFCDDGPVPKRSKNDDSNIGNPAQDCLSESQKALEELDKVQTELDGLNEAASDEILKIPNFWVTVFINHPQISNILEEEEEECLHYLTQVEIEENEDIKAGYKLKFSFDQNPFFENSEIVKEFNWTAAEPNSVTTEIKWKQGKNKLANGTGNEEQSFFKWLCQNIEPVSDEIAEVIKDDIWPNPLQYFLAPDVEALDDEDNEEEDDGGDDDGDEKSGDGR
uniref:SET protein n=1 Tax=Globodera rostochiensis TaxID=31243 RepID=A0A914I8E7_GLORO